MLPYVVEENYHYKYQDLAFTKPTKAWISRLLSVFLTQEYRGHNCYTYKFIVVPEAGVQMKGFVLGEKIIRAAKPTFFLHSFICEGARTPAHLRGKRTTFKGQFSLYSVGSGDRTQISSALAASAFILWAILPALRITFFNLLFHQSKGRGHLEHSGGKLRKRGSCWVAPGRKIPNSFLLYWWARANWKITISQNVCTGFLKQKQTKKTNLLMGKGR